jgi:ABC-type transporter Mla subunit MlaD
VRMIKLAQEYVGLTRECRALAPLPAFDAMVTDAQKTLASVETTAEEDLGTLGELVTKLSTQPSSAKALLPTVKKLTDGNPEIIASLEQAVSQHRGHLAELKALAHPR